MTDVADRFDRSLGRVQWVAKADTRDARTKIPPTADVGSSGLKQSSGLIMEEFDRNLQGTKAIKVYTEMGASPIVGGVLLLISEWMSGATWTVVPYEADVPEYEADAEFLESVMDDMSHSWTAFVDDVATMVQFGWSWFHVVYKARDGVKPRPGDSSQFTDGKWGWRKFSFKGQDSLQRWVFDDEGGIAGWWQRTQDQGLKFLPIERGMLFRTTARKGNPEGRSLLRGSYEPWWKKKRLEEIEGIGHERNLAGLPVLYVAPEILDDDEYSAQKDAYEEIIKNIRIDEQMGVLLPMQYDVDADGKPVAGAPLFKLELLASPGSSRNDIDKTIMRYAREIAMAVLADVILMGHQSSGVGSSQGVAITKDDMLKRSMMGLLQRTADVINRHEIPRLFRLNGRLSGGLPRLEVAPPDSTKAADIVKMLVDLASTGAILWPSAELSNYVQATTGIPLADVADEQESAAEEEDDDDDPAPTPPKPAPQDPENDDPEIDPEDE